MVNSDCDIFSYGGWRGAWRGVLNFLNSIITAKQGLMKRRFYVTCFNIGIYVNCAKKFTQYVTL